MQNQLDELVSTARSRTKMREIPVQSGTKSGTSFNGKSHFSRRGFSVSREYHMSNKDM